MRNKDLNVLTDESIVKMAQEGSGTAYEYLIDKYKELAKIKSKTYYIAGGDNEDVIQEGMIGIFKAIRDFDEEKDASFRTFAELCITRQITNAIKGANRQKHQILNESVPLHMGSGAEEGAEGAFAEHFASSSPDTDPESMMLMKEVVDYLKENDRDIFSPLESKVWKEMLKGKNYREIALELRRPAKAIDNAIQRIKKKIETQLKP
ncbi:MAG: RNA polymerase sporulation sigma factor SigH [Firmicutes bacterium]|nr:RNA polymerase sporulation sigma factor SigH [Bacillota bacterium]